MYRELALAALSLPLFVLLKILTAKKMKLPPGPGGLPILGSAHKLPTRFQEQTFSEWGKQYGDVVYFKIFRTPTIVLNTIEAARDLLDKRSLKYSDRPRMVLFAEMLGEEATLPPTQYGERFRKARKWMYDAVGNKEVIRKYQYIQRREAYNLLRNLLNDPERYFDWLHLYIAAIMVEVTYGTRVNSVDDELVRISDRGINTSNAMGTPGSRLVDFFPILKFIPSWFPGAGFKREAKVVRGYVQEWMNTGYNRVLSAMASGTVAPCIFTHVLTEYGGAPPRGIEEDDVKALTVNVYGAGLETSRGTLAMFVLHMTRNPRVFRKSQDEIDRVVGSDRLPSFGDRASLPYLNAILEEVLRWNPSLPMAIPHCVRGDDEYRGYHIPAGCMVIPNTWAMTRDPRYYPGPDDFRPERFLEPSPHGGEVLLPSSFVFGFGRRVCPGQLFADASVWLAIANVVALFDIRKAIDEDGNEITPPAEFESGFSTQPVPFVCTIAPRSDKASAMISHLDG